MNELTRKVLVGIGLILVFYVVVAVMVESAKYIESAAGVPAGEGICTVCNYIDILNPKFLLLATIGGVIYFARSILFETNREVVE